MDIPSFDDLPRAAPAQPAPQRLLCGVARTGLPGDATPAQRAQCGAGPGGALGRRMCVPRAPHELDSFAALVRECAQFGQDGQREWGMVPAAALPGMQHHAPPSAGAGAPLRARVKAVRSGQTGHFIPFHRQGAPVRLGWGHGRQ